MQALLPAFYSGKKEWGCEFASVKVSKKDNPNDRLLFGFMSYCSIDTFFDCSHTQI